RGKWPSSWRWIAEVLLDRRIERSRLCCSFYGYRRKNRDYSVAVGHLRLLRVSTRRRRRLTAALRARIVAQRGVLRIATVLSLRRRRSWLRLATELPPDSLELEREIKGRVVEERALLVGVAEVGFDEAHVEAGAHRFLDRGMEWVCH